MLLHDTAQNQLCVYTCCWVLGCGMSVVVNQAKYVTSGFFLAASSNAHYAHKESIGTSSRIENWGEWFEA